MDPNQEETRPVTLLAWHWAKLEKVAAEMDVTMDAVIQQFVCLNVQELPRIERKLEADDLIRETGATPPDDDDDEDEGTYGDFISDITGTRDPIL